MLDGQPVTAAQLAKMCGVTRHAIYYRLHVKGLTPEAVVAMPYYSKADYTLNGKRMKGREISNALNYDFSTFHYRAQKNGTTIQQEIDREYTNQHP